MSVSNVAKIAITPMADEALSKALEKVNENFNAGRVTKTDLASWFITQAAENLDDRMIAKIHSGHFDRVAYLQSVVTQLKKGQANETQLNSLLAPVLGKEKIVSARRQKETTNDGDENVRS